MSIEHKLKEARAKKNISQAKLSKEIGISQQAYCLYETGKRIPKYETRVKIAAALGIPVSELLETQEELEAKNRELEQDIKGDISDEERLQKMNEHLTNSELKKEVTDSGWNELFPFYDSLNAAGKAKAKEYIQDLLCARQYQGMIHTKAIPFLNSKRAWSSLEQNHLEKKKD